ncbi:MAG: hypothetical protein AB1630_01020 [bacterium]
MKKKMGITLVELLISLVCMVAMVGVVYQIFLMTERIHIRTGARVEAEYNIREALDLMTSELRHAGYRYWNPFDEDTVNSPNFAYDVDRIGINSSTSTAIFEGDFDESGTVQENEHITYDFASNTRTLRRGTGKEAVNWNTVANNIDDVTFTYRDANGNIVNMPATTTDVTDTIRSIDVGILFNYPIRGEGRTLTTRIDTNVRLRNTYYVAKVKSLE